MPVDTPSGMASLALTLLPSTSYVPWRMMLRVVRNLAVGLVLFLVIGNLAITAAWQMTARRSAHVVPAISGITNLSVVDDAVWRSAAPSSRSYGELADAGVRTIVDLRAEENLRVDVDALAALGIRWVHLPIRDGQIPSDEQVRRFLGAVDGSEGITLVHCGAGVGRTGAMVAAYRVATGESSGLEAMRANLAVGPPSLEQLAFAASLDGGLHRPPVPLVFASRVLDSPRRLWSRYGL